MNVPKTILVATDFSEHADHALEYAAGLATQLDATLHLVHSIGVAAMGVPELGVAYNTLNMQAMTAHAEAELERRAASYRDRATLAPVRVEIGDARDVIDRVAEQIGADLIVMGTHGRRGLRRLVLGSVAESVVRTAPCPVLTIRPKQKRS